MTGMRTLGVSVVAGSVAAIQVFGAWGGSPGAVERLAAPPQATSRQLHELPPPAWSIALGSIGFQSIPTSMLAHGNLLVFASARGQVRSIDTRNRRVAWSITLPSDSIHPGAMFAASDSTIIVAGRPDQAPVGLAVSTGVVTTKWLPINRVWLSACGLKTGGAVVATIDDHSPLLRMDARGSLTVGHALPWPHLAEAHPLQRQVVLGPESGRNRCLLALAASDGLAMMHDGEVTWQARFRTPAATSAVESTRTNMGPGRFTISTRLRSLTVAAFGAAVAGDMGFVAMGSPPPLGFRLIDVHHADDGRYLGSLVTPSRIGLLAANGRTLFLVAQRDGHPTLFAYDLRAIRNALAR